MSREQDEQATAKRLNRLLVNCTGYKDDELSNARKQALDYYFQRPRGDEVDGRSQIVTGDLSAMVEGNLAQMVEPLSGKRIAEFCAYSSEDKTQADIESACINELIFERRPGFITLAEAIKSAMLNRNCVMKIFIDTRTYKRRVRRKNVTSEVVPAVLDKIGKTDVHKFDPETGTLDATVTKVTRVFKAEALAPECILVPKGWHRHDFEDCPIVAEYHEETRATLIERGYPREKVSRMRRCTQPSSSSKTDRLPNGLTPQNVAFDNSQELVAWYECYVRVESEDGTSELRCIAKAADQNIILADDPAEYIPYASGVLFLNPHSWIGIGLHDKLKSTQDTSTALTRALMDNLNAVSKARTAHLDGVVEEDDLTDGRINHSIRVRHGAVQDVRQAITAFQVPDASGNIITNLQHMKQTRSEMGGASLDMATGQVQLAERTGSMGLDRAYSVMEALAAFMTRVIAQTLIRQLYLRAHETLRAEWHEPIRFLMGKEWIETNPAEWPAREALRVNLGASVGERARMSALLEKLMEKQAGLAAHGMEDILVSAEAYYNAFVEWLRINDIAVPEHYILNPKSPPSVQAMQRKQQQQQLQQRKQEAMVTDAIALEQLRTALEKYKTDTQNTLEYYKTVINAQIEEAKLATQAVVDLRKAMITATNQQREASNDARDPKSSEGDNRESASGPRSGSSVAVENGAD